MFNPLAKLFGRTPEPNPTAAWPPPVRPELIYNLCARSLNGLPLGGTFAAAQPFGRCDDFERLDEYLDLFYHSAGLGLQFAGDELIGIVLAVANGSGDGKEKKLGPGRPVIIAPDGQRHAFNASSTLPDLIACFGQPLENNPGDDGSMQTFITHKNVIDAFLDPKTFTLQQLDICETNDA